MKNRIITFLLCIFSIGCSKIESRPKMVINETYEVTYSLEDQKGNREIIKTINYDIKGNEDIASDKTNNFVLKNITSKGPETILLQEKVTGKIGTLEYDFGDLRLEQPAGHKFPIHDLLTFHRKENLNKTRTQINFYLDIRKK